MRSSTLQQQAAIGVNPDDVGRYVPPNTERPSVRRYGIEIQTTKYEFCM